ncbi:MAG: polysaccharide biosynthesis protein [Salinivirgaceae bacterium]|nr:polysaccharide biosynthesis protein [Salinivirgaceae bacterium]
MMRIRTNFILNTISQVLRIITPFITTPYVARVLGVDNVGIFSYSYSLQSYFCLLAVLGTATYGTREIARLRDNKKTVSVAFWEIELLRAVTTLLAFVGWIILIGCQSENIVVFEILTIYIVAALFDISWFYAGLELFPYIVSRNVVIRVLEVVAIFIFVKSTDDLPVYCLIMGGGTFVGNITLWVNLRKYVNKLRFSECNPFRHMKDVMVYFVPSVATTIYTVLDKTLIGTITQSTYENGIYEQTTKVIEIAKAITFTSLNAVLCARNSYLFINKEYDKIKINLQLSLSIMLALGFGFTFGIAAISDRFVPIFFGVGYDGVILLLKLLSPIIVIIAISNALGDQYYNPAGLRIKSAKYLIVGAICNLILNLALIPYLKSAGAVIASIIAEIIISALYLINCDGYLHLRQILSLSYKKIIAGVFMYGIIVLSCRMVPDTIIGLLILILMGGLGYILMLALFKDNVYVFAVDQLLQRKQKIKKDA